jgi:hypothetical protein
MTNEKTIQDRLEESNQNVIGDFYRKLQGDARRSKKYKIAEIHTTDEKVILSCDKHFYYLNDFALVGCRNSKEMLQTQVLLFNLLYYLYGDDFKIEPDFAE